jgi:hypothetical protein
MSVIAARHSIIDDIVVGSHQYAVLAVAGNWITIRNPWGVDSDGSPVLVDGANDGIVRLHISTFRRVLDGGIAYA